MTIRVAAMDGGAADIFPEVLRSFKAGFMGAVLTPDDAAYEESRQSESATGLVLLSSRQYRRRKERGKMSGQGAAFAAASGAVARSSRAISRLSAAAGAQCPCA